MKSQFAEPPSDSELQIDGWSSVTWDDIQEWAGSRNVERGRSYQRRGHVKELIQTGNRRLMATVVGNDKYQVSVWRIPDRTGGDSLKSHCTCPVGHNHCKHAVAVIAEYFQTLAAERKPAIDIDNHQSAGQDPNDSSLNRIVPVAHGDPPAPESLAEPLRTPSGVRPSAQTSSWDGSLKDNLRSKSHEELVDLVCSLLQRFSELRADVRDRLGGSEPPSN